jgi:phosphoribosylformimino-5-aminoimidazole carboxamide ribonucleotide (ProFAR) isomerase
VSELLYTNVDRDGMLAGPNSRKSTVSRAVTGSLITRRDRRLTIPRPRGWAALLSGVIVGEALYEQRFTVAEAGRLAG